jgi:hypothetical protein
MDDIIYTLQDFMLHTESVTYIIMGISLIGVAGFWLFLNQTDKDEDRNRKE